MHTMLARAPVLGYGPPEQSGPRDNPRAQVSGSKDGPSQRFMMTHSTPTDAPAADSSPEQAAEHATGQMTGQMTGQTTGKTTHFGFRTVAEDKKADMVRGVFNSVAGRYDVMNDVMSAGVHRLWKNSLIDSLNPRPGMHLLDLAGGTGDIAFRFLDACRGGTVSVCDINAEMLAVGKARAEAQGYADRAEFICGDAMKLPFGDKSADAYTISFGIRNVTRIEEAIAEAYRVLKPGGKFFVLEFSPAVVPVLKRAYDAYSFTVIPKMGELITKDADSYQYLVESIRRFPAPDTFADMIGDAGFSRVKWRSMSAGVVAIHSGTRI
jgi:demethylmenaquinone methyltransferase/2-methoxy-6-polyprenyl-1,4-benzoquinol methylase